MAVDELFLRETPRSESRRTASEPCQGSPAGSTDFHFHIFGPHDRYSLNPARGYTLSPEANIDTCPKVAETLGIERMVIVNPHPYDTNHQCGIDSLEIFGRKRAKGVAVVN